MITTQVTIYPNPFLTTLSVEVVVDNNSSAIVRMLDQQHKIVKMMSWNLKKGSNKTSLNDLETLPAGAYFIDIKNMEGENLFNTKLVKI